jgi:flagellar protein FlbD
MIRLIRKDGVEILLNIDMIKTIEKTPETVITLINGEKLVVKNAVGDITEKMRAYRLGIQEEMPKQSDDNNDLKSGKQDQKEE